jgi:hypothetical protein
MRFWPGEWLPYDLPEARIYTFGYNANFASGKSTTANILDFAKQIIFEMAFSPEGFGQVGGSNSYNEQFSPLNDVIASYYFCCA